MARMSLFKRETIECANTRAGLQARGADYLVKTVPLAYCDDNGERHDVPRTFGLFTSQGLMLQGSVGPEYRVVQHAEQLAIADDIAAAGLAELEGVGVVDGSTAFALLNVPSLRQQLGNEDAVEWRILVRSSHGRQSNAAIVTREQFWCANQLPTLARSARTSMRLRHSGNVGFKLDEMREVLAMAATAAREEWAVLQSLQGKRMTRTDLQRVVREWLAVEAARDEEKRAKLEQEARRVEAQPSIHDGTALGVLDRITHYLDHARRRYTHSAEGARRLVASSIDGDTAKRRQRALELVVR